MLLHPDPRLAEVPGFKSEQLDALARSVELRRQQLEDDIRDYIKAKQDDLRQYEQELVIRYRSMECHQHTASAEKNPTRNAESSATSPASQDQPAPSSPDAREPEPEPAEKIKQKKPSKVHKREKELYGLVTPAFLPLLDAREISPEKRKEKKKPKPEIVRGANDTATGPQAGASRDADKSKDSRKHRKDDDKDLEGTMAETLGKENQQADAVKKAKRSPMKKSALRHKDTPRSRRKRVSLVIDGQTVLPADSIREPALTSPSSEATSASNSTASLDDMIDPRLTAHDSPVYLEHRDAVHHSLPLPMSNAIHAYTKPLADTPAPVIATNPSPPSPRAPSVSFGPTQIAARTFLDPSPSRYPQSMPASAGPDPIFSMSDPASAELELDDLTEEEQHFDTYVGGLHGSGVDDVDQAGSYGYPSSLGASYMESYMQTRPLSVRMQAADKAGLDEEEKRMLLAEKDEDVDDDDDFGVEMSTTRNRNNRFEVKEQAREIDDDNFMGDMEDF